MVNFRDPAVVARNSRTYSFIAVSDSLEVESIFIRFLFFESCALGVLARREWSFYASLPVLCTNILLLQNITNTMATFLVGSLSRLLILNGVSSKDVAATVGRSGSVVIAPSFKNPWLPGDRMADFCFWQVYSLSRVAALMAVISTLVLLNLSTPYNCQVCSMLLVGLTENLVLTCHYQSSLSISR
jgi:hypothetical protein